MFEMRLALRRCARALPGQDSRALRLHRLLGMIHAWSGTYGYPIWRIYPNTETFDGGRYRADVSVAKNRQLVHAKRLPANDNCPFAEPA